MSVFNDAAFVAQAVESILGQTWQDFEFLAIDDGSTDGSGDYLAQMHDPRLRLWRNEKNLGLTRSLKLGIEMAQGQYIVRMDADDIAHTERLARQIAYLDQHPEVGVLGSACRLIDAQGHKQGEYPAPGDDLHIRWTSLLSNPFVHPTVMLRREVLTHNRLNYDEAYRVTQDYDLWTRMLRYTQGANLQRHLLQYRRRHGMTSLHRPDQLWHHDTVALRTIREQLPDLDITPEQVSDLRALLVGGRESRPGLETRRAALADLYLDMLQAFANRHPGKAEMQNINRHAAAKVIFFCLYPLFPPGTRRILRRLTTLDPAWPSYVASEFLHAAIRRFYRGRL